MSKMNCWQTDCSWWVSCLKTWHTKLSLVLQELCWLQGGMNSNISTYVSTWVDRKVCTGSRSILANKNSLLEKVCVSLRRKYIHLQSDPRKAVGQSKSPPCAISTAAGRWGCYHAMATIVLCLMPIFTRLASIFPGVQRAGSKGTAPWSGGGYDSGTVVPRLWLDPRLPLIGMATILWPTLSYEYPKLWAKRQMFGGVFFILEPFSEQPAVETGSSCSVKVRLVG